MSIDNQKKFKTKLELIKQKEEEEKAKKKAEQLNLPYLNLATSPIDPKALAVIPKPDAQKANILAVRKANYELYLTVTDPSNAETKKIINQLKKDGYKCHLFIVSQRSINLGLKRYEFAEKEKTVLRGNLIIQETETEEFKRSLSTIQKLKETVRTISTSKLLSIIVTGAIKMNASDIHLEPEKNKIRLRYRIDGVLQDIAEFKRESYHFLLSRIKTLSEMMINVEDVSQDGRFSIKIMKEKETVKEINVRSSVLPSIYGESIVLRLLGIGIAKLKLSKIGIRPELYPILEKQISRPNGMILSTGPTGSGKTTTLYACLNYINKPSKKIITVENPIEYKLTDITQTQVSERKGQTFAQSLKTIVRQDPDILMVGEIRDKESAETSLHFSLTGHIVFSTLHTNNAAATIPRLINIGISPSILPSALNLIIAQRLVRKLCPDCKTSYQPDKETVQKLKKIISLIPPKLGIKTPPKIDKLYKPSGCPKCHGIGYRGRIGVFELLVATDEIKELIAKQVTTNEIHNKAIQQGMITLIQSAALKTIEGTTSLDEVKRVVGFSQKI